MKNLMTKNDLCLVTGVSGYLGSWIAKDLLEQGLRVRGTVRSLGDEFKVNIVRSLLPGVELVAADLRSSEGWTEAVADCRWVFHVASPQAVRSEKDRTGGAVQGSEYLMRAALRSITVEKIVLTSSEAAIAYGHPATKQYFTEDDWTVLDSAAGRYDYMRSKTLAEKLAWDLAVDRRVNTRGVPLAVVNPGFIAGPSLVPWGRFSLEMLRSIVEGRIPIFPDMENHVVDVRDCARMHIVVMDDLSTNGHRHFSFGATGKMVDFAHIIRENYAHMGFKPRTWIIPKQVAWVLGHTSSNFAVLASKLGHPNVYETKWPGVYRYQYTDLTEIVNASIKSMLEHGWIKPRNETSLRGLQIAPRQRCWVRK